MTGYPAGGVVKQLQRSAAERSAGRLIRLRAEVAGAQELVYPSRISAAETATTVMSLWQDDRRLFELQLSSLACRPTTTACRPTNRSGGRCKESSRRRINAVVYRCALPKFRRCFYSHITRRVRSVPEILGNFYDIILCTSPSHCEYSFPSQDWLHGFLAAAGSTVHIRFFKCFFSFLLLCQLSVSMR